MRPLWDAVKPPRIRPGEAWAGYLASPTAYRPWTPPELHAAAHAGGLLPVYVAPIDPAGYRARDADHDALTAVRQLRDLDLAPLVVALDTEPRAYNAAPDAAITYAAAFTRQCIRLGAHPIHYAAQNFLVHLADHIDTRTAWLAWWTTSTVWPAVLEPWTHPRGWQHATNITHHGVNTDLSRIDDTFPLAQPARRAPAPTPPPAAAHNPADVHLAAAARRWLHTKEL